MRGLGNLALYVIDIQPLLDAFYGFIESGLGTLVFSILSWTISWIISRHYYRKGRISMGPRYLTQSFHVVNMDSFSSKNAIKISYGKKKTPFLCITNLAFWNEGKESITKYSVAKMDPLKIEIEKGFNILDYDVLYKEKENNINFNLTTDKTCLEITFDYLAYNQGFVLKLFHTANSGNCIKVKGSFTSGVKIDKPYYFPDNAYFAGLSSRDLLGKLKLTKYRKLLGRICYKFCFISLIPLIVIMIDTFIADRIEASKISAMLFCSIFCIILFICAGWFLSRNNPPENMIGYIDDK